MPSKPGACNPLDPLTSGEISTAARITREEAKFRGYVPDDSAQFVFVEITLEEPPKKAYLAWKTRHAPPPPRLAAVTFQVLPNPMLLHCCVDMGSESAYRFKEVPDFVPWATPEDCARAEQIAKDSTEFQQLLKERYGVTDMGLVVCDPWSVHAMPEGLPGFKIMQIFVYLRSFPEDNQYAHPVDLVPFVDVLEGKVIRIDKHDKPPEINRQDSNYHSKLTQPRNDLLKPLNVVQPQGPSFSVSGHEVSWWKWTLHVGFNAREGLVLNDLRFDGRPVLHRISLVEMAVPYADPNEPYVRKCAFDVGDYGLGNTANSLQVGCDCLGAIRYFDGMLNNSKGEPVCLPKCVCMHEEDVGLLWKHVEMRNGHNESRRSRRLVLSFVSTVVNYEYCFYYYLYMDGTISFEIKLTGELSTNVLSPGEEEPEYGTLVMPHVNAQHHQHMFCARIDPAIDDAQGGKDVVVTEVNCEPVPPGPQNPYANAFRAKEEPLLSVKAAQRNANVASNRIWKMSNPKVLNPITKKPVSYKLVPNAAPGLLAHPTDSIIAQKAVFASKDLWVTPHRGDQRFPAGDFVFNQKKCHGLSRWAEQDASLEGADPIIWYSFGVTHVVRIEDFPIMPTESVSFELKPFGFFQCNPTLDAPRDVNKASVDVCACNSDKSEEHIVGGIKRVDGKPAGHSAVPSATMPSMAATMPSIGF